MTYQQAIDFLNKNHGLFIPQEMRDILVEAIKNGPKVPALPEPEFSLEEIEKAQEMVNR